MNDLGKEITFEDSHHQQRQSYVRYESKEFITDDRGGLVYALEDEENDCMIHNRGHALMRDVTEHHLRTKQVLRFLVKCPDGIVRWMSRSEIVNRFGKAQYRRAKRAWGRQHKIVDVATLLPEVDNVDA